MVPLTCFCTFFYISGWCRENAAEGGGRAAVGVVAAAGGSERQLVYLESTFFFEMLRNTLNTALQTPKRLLGSIPIPTYTQVYTGIYSLEFVTPWGVGGGPPPLYKWSATYVFSHIFLHKWLVQRKRRRRRRACRRRRGSRRRRQ